MYSLQKFKRKIPSKKEILLFRKRLLSWFSRNKRSYPWRKTRDPFKLLVAEMMLQRTKADQVLRVYNNFFSEFNSVEEIVNTDLKELEKILYPIGLKWRVRNFKNVCVSLIKNFNEKVPDNRTDLLSLPGVGKYIAGILLSVAFNKTEWIVDSNIVRIFKRHFGVSTIKEGRRDKHIIDLAKTYITARDPKKANLALLDFGALICIPKNPKCTLCPLLNSCYYYSLKRSGN